MCRLGESRDFVIKLPSALIDDPQADLLIARPYDSARADTVRFWTDLLNRGAQFDVPDPVVNELARAVLWHSLRLPRRHGASQAKIDLPYSNFAYAQTGTPWPINQSVYVDYGIYDLRGYHSFSAEEIAEQFKQNQENNGHVAGYANWVSYTPGMLYAISQSYLLSHDTDLFERNLPRCFRAVDWITQQLQSTNSAAGPTAGLVHGPLNDLTGDGFGASTKPIHTRA